jgi:hypothetical protein
MANVNLARWQFAFVTINHFFFVPITIGLAFLTALLQTAWQLRHGRGDGGVHPVGPARARRPDPGDAFHHADLESWQSVWDRP